MKKQSQMLMSGAEIEYSVKEVSGFKTTNKFSLAILDHLERTISLQI